jgi:outer membrane cobalamin receptor
VENLLDQHYQEVFGYNATPGVAAFAGIKLTFGGPDGYRGN